MFGCGSGERSTIRLVTMMAAVPRRLCGDEMEASPRILKGRRCRWMLQQVPHLSSPSSTHKHTLSESPGPEGLTC